LWGACKGEITLAPTRLSQDIRASQGMPLHHTSPTDLYRIFAPTLALSLYSERELKKRFRRNFPDGPSAEGWGCPPAFVNLPQVWGTKGVDHRFCRQLELQGPSFLIISIVPSPSLSPRGRGILKKRCRNLPAGVSGVSPGSSLIPP